MDIAPNPVQSQPGGAVEGPPKIVVILARIEIVLWAIVFFAVGGLMLISISFVSSRGSSGALTPGAIALLLVPISISIFMIVTAIAISRFQRWGLYTFTGVTVLSFLPALYHIAQNPGSVFSELTPSILSIAFLIVFWKHARWFR